MLFSKDDGVVQASLRVISVVESRLASNCMATAGVGHPTFVRYRPRETYSSIIYKNIQTVKMNA